MYKLCVYTYIETHTNNICILYQGWPTWFILFGHPHGTSRALPSLSTTVLDSACESALLGPCTVGGGGGNLRCSWAVYKHIGVTDMILTPYMLGRSWRKKQLKWITFFLTYKMCLLGLLVWYIFLPSFSLPSLCLVLVPILLYLGQGFSTSSTPLDTFTLCNQTAGRKMRAICWNTMAVNYKCYYILPVNAYMFTRYNTRWFSFTEQSLITYVTLSVIER
jgi:hypothetical protein